MRVGCLQPTLLDRLCFEHREIPDFPVLRLQSPNFERIR